jgi:hypothetical protein
MRYLGLLAALVLAAPGVEAGMAPKAARAASRIIVPGAPLTAPQSQIITIGPAGPLIVPEAPKIILPKPVIHKPEPQIVPAARALTPEEAAPQVLPAQEELQRLADSLAAPPQDQKRDPEPEAGALGGAFDGSRLNDAKPAVEYFAGGPLAPELPQVVAAARSLWAALLPSLYRRVPMRIVYDRSDRPETGHTWSPETGHTIEISPVSADSRGQVPTDFGGVGQTWVQQKIEQLMLMGHEYAHVIFDAAVGRTDNHQPASAYSAMTEGFALTAEQLLIERLLARPDAFGFKPQDAMDLAALASARRNWLAAADTHYAEGAQPWRLAFERGGDLGLRAFLSGLSPRRMAATQRSDPAYQLAVAEPDLLAAYLGPDADHPHRRGLEAFARAGRGDTLSEAEARLAADAIERAGPEGRWRLFERSLLADKHIPDPTAPAPPRSPGLRWWEPTPEPLSAVAPAFALARLSPAGAAELARFLAETVSSPGGLENLFVRPGPEERTTAVIAGAEALPWTESDHAVWTKALMAWVTGLSS